ncbi:hypothetical protein FI667_g8482, partial [Globisporangium splendens]
MDPPLSVVMAPPHVALAVAADAPSPHRPPPHSLPPPAAAPLPPGHALCGPTSCTLTLFQVLTLGVVPALVLAAVETSHAYLLLLLGNVVLAVGALEWSWLAFRLRKKLLFSLETPYNEEGENGDEDTGVLVEIEQDGGDDTRVQGEFDSDTGGENDNSDEQDRENDDYSSLPTNANPITAFQLRRLREMQPSRYAVADLAARFCDGRWYVCAFPIAVCVAGACFLLAFWIEHSVFNETKNKPFGWHMLTAVTVNGAFLSAFFGCLAPSKLDTIVAVVYQMCFVASSMNTFLMYYVGSIAVTDLVDPLFILLVGACAIIVMRIVTSKFVMESLLLVVFDSLGLVMFAGSMVAVADFVDHPGAAKFRVKLALFFLVVFASEIGHWLTRVVKTRCPQICRCCRRCWGITKGSKGRSTATRSAAATTTVDAVLKARHAIAPLQDAQAFVVAVVFAGIMILLSRIWGHNQSLGAVETIVLLLAVILGQWSRALLSNMKQVAEVSTTAFYLTPESRVGGVLDRVAVFFVAVIVYHPYAKHVYYS